MLSSLTLDASITPERISHPDATLVFTVFQALSTQWPALKQASSDLAAAQSRAQERESEVELLLSDAEQVRKEALSRARNAEEEARTLSKQTDALKAELDAANAAARAQEGSTSTHHESLQQLENAIRDSQADKRNLTAMLSKAKDASAGLEGEYLLLIC